MDGGTALGTPSARPHPAAPFRRGALRQAPGAPGAPGPPHTLPSALESGFRLAICLRVFSPLPPSRSLSEVLLPAEVAEVAEWLPLGTVFPCHVTPVGHMAAFHTAAQTPTAVFVGVLLTPAGRLPGARGASSGCLPGCSGLSSEDWQASLPGLGVGTVPLHSEQEHLCTPRARLQEASEA